MVDNLALADHTARTTALFERLLGHANDLGLLAEELDPASDPAARQLLCSRVRPIRCWHPCSPLEWP
jgi:hypothetical protein